MSSTRRFVHDHKRYSPTGVGGVQPRCESSEIRIAFAAARGDISKCAKSLGYSYAGMYGALKNLDLISAGKNEPKTKDWNPVHIATLRRAGASFAKLAQLRGVGETTVWKFCRKNGIA